MAITVIRTAPDPSTFTALTDFQSQTPESLADTDVLHYSSEVDVVFTPPAASLFKSSSLKVYVTSKYPRLLCGN